MGKKPSIVSSSIAITRGSCIMLTLNVLIRGVPMLIVFFHSGTNSPWNSPRKCMNPGLTSPSCLMGKSFVSHLWRGGWWACSGCPKIMLISNGFEMIWRCACQPRHPINMEPNRWALSSSFSSCVGRFHLWEWRCVKQENSPGIWGLPILGPIFFVGHKPQLVTSNMFRNAICDSWDTHNQFQGSPVRTGVGRWFSSYFVFPSAFSITVTWLRADSRVYPHYSSVYSLIMLVESPIIDHLLIDMYRWLFCWWWLARKSHDNPIHIPWTIPIVNG
jgi:hypothetical protein